MPLSFPIMQFLLSSSGDIGIGLFKSDDCDLIDICIILSNLSAVQSVFQSVKKIYQTFKTKGGVIDELKCAKKRIIGREGHPFPGKSGIVWLL